MIFNVFGRTRRPRKIDLNDLARAFWQDRPTDEAQSVEQGEKNNGLLEFPWKKSMILDFWRQYVMLYRNTITPPVLRVIESLLSSLEGLSECPSVSEDDDETLGQYLQLSMVSLLDHTLNVCREAADLMKERQNDFQMNIGQVLIAALAHDLGKHPALRIPNMPHSFNSAQWLQKRIGHLRDREQIIEAVRCHHLSDNSGKQTVQNPILAILAQADTKARRSEMACIQSELQMNGYRG